MKRAKRVSNGYAFGGKVYPKLFGSRREVWNETAIRTEGKLQLKDLMMNRWGEIVSKNKHASAVAEQRLQKHGFQPGFGTHRKKRNS